MIKTARPFPKRFIITHLFLLKEIAAKRITIFTVNGSHILSSDLIPRKAHGSDFFRFRRGTLAGRIYSAFLGPIAQLVRAVDS